MPESKNIAEKIITFLRKKGSEAEVGGKNTAGMFGCHLSVVCRTLERLKAAGVIKAVTVPAPHRPIRYALNKEFREGDGWREALKRKFSDGKSDDSRSKQSTPVKTPKGGTCNDECLGVRKALLAELVGVYERLRVSQEENRTLHQNVAELQKRVGDLEDDIKSRNSVCRQLRNDVNQLETRLRELRNQTSQPPLPRVTGKNLMLDNSGVVTMPNEGLPDRR